MPALLCPICQYDCSGVQGRKCPECGAELDLVLVSRNQLRFNRLQVNSLVISGLILLTCFTLVRIAAFSEETKIQQMRFGVDAYQTELRDYQAKMIKWWSKLRANEDPGNVPVVPKEPSQTREILGAVNPRVLASRFGLALVPLCLSIASGVLIIWASWQRYPLSAIKVVVSGKIIYFLCATWLIFAAVFVLSIVNLN